jgi:hypothetical protein
VRLGATNAAEKGLDAPALDAVSFTARRNVVASGRARGTLETVSKTKIVKRYRFAGALRHGKLRVTFHPGAKRFAEVTGLPPGTAAVNLRLDGGAVRLRSAAQAWSLAATLRGGGDTVTVSTGGRYV